MKYIAFYLLQVLEELTRSDLRFEQKAAKLMRIGTVPAIAVKTTLNTGQLSYELYHSRFTSANLFVKSFCWIMYHFT